MSIIDNFRRKNETPVERHDFEKVVNQTTFSNFIYDEVSILNDFNNGIFNENMIVVNFNNIIDNFEKYFSFLGNETFYQIIRNKIINERRVNLIYRFCEIYYSMMSVYPKFKNQGFLNLISEIGRYDFTTIVSQSELNIDNDRWMKLLIALYNPKLNKAITLRDFLNDVAYKEDSYLYILKYTCKSNNISIDTLLEAYKMMNNDVFYLNKTASLINDMSPMEISAAFKNIEEFEFYNNDYGISSYIYNSSNDRVKSVICK